MRFVLIAVLLFTGSAAAMAQNVAPSTPPATPEKKICRSEPQLGSIMYKRICHTRAEWASIEQQNRANADRVRDNSNAGSPTN